MKAFYFVRQKLHLYMCSTRKLKFKQDVNFILYEPNQNSSIGWDWNLRISPKTHRSLCITYIADPSKGRATYGECWSVLRFCDQKKEKVSFREEVLFSTMIAENSDHGKMNPLLCAWSEAEDHGAKSMWQSKGSCLIASEKQRTRRG